MKVWSWGAHAFTGFLPKNIPSIKKPTLQFAVNGHHFKGNIRIELDEGADLYNIHFGKYGSRHENGWKNISSIERIYADEITEVIDQMVEYIPLYKSN